MNWQPFQTRVSGKWVLTGEHAVLRGVTAVALPHPEFGLELAFHPETFGRLEVHPPTAQPVIDGILHSIQSDHRVRGQGFELPQGRLEIRSTIPIGAGLGSSAALCVAMGKWLSAPLALSPAELVDFATRLEHRFHGRSSGMDVAVIATEEPISFVMPQGDSAQGGAAPLGVRKLPRFTFHDTGLRTRTSEAVHQVQKLWEDDPTLSRQIDEQMAAASRMALEGLSAYDSAPSSQSLRLIAQALRQGQECFESWKLVPIEARRIIDSLIAQGALAAKMTGAGGGGMIVALWEG